MQGVKGEVQRYKVKNRERHAERNRKRSREKERGIEKDDNNQDYYCQCCCSHQQSHHHFGVLTMASNLGAALPSRTELWQPSTYFLGAQ